MPFTVTLRPETDLGITAGTWTVVGPGSAASALADESLATYLRYADKITTGDRYGVTMSSVALAATQRVRQIRPRTALAYISPGAVSSLVAYFGTGTTESAMRRLVLHLSAQTDDLGAMPTTAASGEWTQAEIDGMQVVLRVELPGGTPEDSILEEYQLAYLAVDLDVVNQPIVAAVSLNGLTVSTRYPVIAWTLTLDAGEVQSGYEVQLFTQAQYSIGGFDPATSPATFSAGGSNAATAVVDTVALDPGGRYRAYVRAKIVLIPDPSGKPGGVEWWSAWAYGEFTVAAVVDPVATLPLPTSGTLGCPEYQAFLVERGAASPWAELRWQAIRWGRVLEEISEASVDFGARDACALLRKPERWRDELHVVRDGILEWVGPVMQLDYDQTAVTVAARDRAAWLEVRRVAVDDHYIGADLALIFVNLAASALTPDDPGLLLVYDLAGVTGEREVHADEYRIAGDLLREIGRSVVDWTVWRDTLYIGGTEFAVPALPTITDAFVVPPRISEQGLDQASEWTIIGGIAGTPVVGQAGGTGTFGLVQRVAAEPQVLDLASAVQAAQSRLDLMIDGTRQIPIGLLPSAPYAMGQLLPGSQVPVILQAPAWPLDATLRLRRVAVNVAADGNEAVTVTLEPLGTT